MQKSDEELVAALKDHIQSFPRYESHYTRSHNPKRKYLHPGLNLRQMYNLYVEQCKENHKTFLSEQIYRKIFKKDFNLSFHHPHKDTCQKCDLLNMKIKATSHPDEKSSLIEKHSIHLNKAELARKCLKEDQNLASNNPEKYFSFSFDLQKALPYPKLTVSIAYYKRNMYVLNEGFHNFHDNKVHMYTWEETVASRGAEEVASCCLKHIQNVTTQDHIIAYSDMCTGQNRNIKLALMWLRIVQSDDNNINIIDHKFLLSGHSFLPNDRDFGVVEMVLKKKDQLYTAEDYYNTIRSCRKQNKFNLYVMKREDFVSTKSLEEAISNRKKNTEGETVKWLEICWMRFTRNEPHKLFYKTSMEENASFKVLFLFGKQGRPKHLSKITMLPLHKTSRPITKEKYDDMMSLLPYIPPIYHEYFTKLSVQKK